MIVEKLRVPVQRRAPEMRWRGVLGTPLLSSRRLRELCGYKLLMKNVRTSGSTSGPALSERRRDDRARMAYT